MIRRNLRDALLESLSDFPVVFLRGPRQAGKTTLVRSLADVHGAAYYTFDNSTLLAAAADANGFVRGLPGPVILDEAQRVPDLFLAIKAAVDRDRRPGRFLLTGSADIMHLPRAADALVGRMAVHTLWPLSRGEIEGHREDFIHALFSDGPLAPGHEGFSRDDLAQAICSGGYPDAWRRSAARRQEWFSSYLMLLLQRDVRDLSRLEGLTDLPRLLSGLAAGSSRLLSYSSLARTLGMPQTTMKRYMAVLEATLIYRPLPAWSANLGKRLAKAPKILLTDTGLACHLVGTDAGRLRSDRVLIGHLAESFVVCELIKQSTWSEEAVTLHHYRTHAQREVDIVLERRDGRLVGVEVKVATTLNDRDLSGLRDLAEAAGDRFHRGVVLYLGDQVVPFGERLHAVPLQALWQK